MKAVLLEKPGPLASGPLALRDDVPDPVAGPGQVLIRVSSCGVCHSNLHMVEGDWLPATPAFTPIVPGHEVVGRVAALGDGVTGFTLGDRVGVQPLWSTCGRCDYCRTGREELCADKLITGESVHGGYAELMVADAGFTHLLPDDLDDVAAAPLFCPGITGYGAVLKAALLPGERVAIFGLGGVGHLALQFAQLTGATTIAVTRGAARRQMASELGADHTVDANTDDRIRVLRRHGGVDAAIVFAPSDQVVGQALQAVRPGGRLILGVNATIGGFPFATEKTITGSLLGNRVMMDTVLALASAGKVRVVAEAMPLAEAGTALRRLKAGEVRGRLVLVP